MKRPLLHEENIVAGLRAEHCEEALRKLLNAIPSWRLAPAVKEGMLELLVLRERLGTTAIGRGVALPHCVSPDVSEPLVIFGVSPEGVPYSSLDGAPVHFIFVLVLPQHDAAEKTKRDILQNIKWFLFDRNLQEKLKAAGSAHEVLDLLSPRSAQGAVFQ